MRKIYSVECMLVTPNEEGIKLDFRTKMLDIFYAVEQFNANFDFKSIKLTDICKQSIQFLFGIEVESDDVLVNARDITVFSKKLYHDRGWSVYSSKESKLFTGVAFDDITDTLNDIYDRKDAIPNDLIEKISAELAEDINSKLDDEQAIKALQALATLKDIGTVEMKITRRRQLTEIKRILLEAIS